MCVFKFPESTFTSLFGIPLWRISQRAPHSFLWLHGSSPPGETLHPTPVWLLQSPLETKASIFSPGPTAKQGKDMLPWPSTESEQLLSCSEPKDFYCFSSNVCYFISGGHAACTITATSILLPRRVHRLYVWEAEGWWTKPEHWLQPNIGTIIKELPANSFGMGTMGKTYFYFIFSVTNLMTEITDVVCPSQLPLPPAFIACLQKQSPSSGLFPASPQTNISLWPHQETYLLLNEQQAH